MGRCWYMIIGVQLQVSGWGVGRGAQDWRLFTGLYRKLLWCESVTVQEKITPCGAVVRRQAFYWGCLVVHIGVQMEKLLLRVGNVIYWRAPVGRDWHENEPCIVLFSSRCQMFGTIFHGRRRSSFIFSGEYNYFNYESGHNFRMENAIFKGKVVCAIHKPSAHEY